MANPERGSRETLVWKSTEPDPVKVAQRLSPAMREGICRQPCPSWWGTAPAAMPHSLGTAEALHARGLIVRPLAWRHRAFPLTPLGLEVRQHLQSLAP
jgi:hypothetical protein